MRTPDELKKELCQYAKDYEVLVFDNEGAKGAMVGHLNKICGGDGNRHLILHFLFGAYSSRELKGGEWYALARWIDAQEIGGKWIPQPDFEQEAQSILTAVFTSQLAKKEVYDFD